MEKSTKKTLIQGIVLLVFVAIALASNEDFQRGAQAGYGAAGGYTYIGDYNSESACASACRSSGYRGDYLWGYQTKHCQCR